MSEKLQDDVLKLFREIQETKSGNAEWFFLSNLAQRVALVRGFQYLLSLEDLNITLFPHQAEAVLQALQAMQGSTLLADEVGLGKTIIALTILSELKIRGLVNSVLIIVPSSLVNQWYQEVIDKFNMEIPVVATGRSNFNKDQMITTAPMLTRYPERIINRSWDMVIIDEAHRYKSRDSKRWNSINQIKKRYMLLLTATPMENYLEDIYNLVTLLKPIFGSWTQFRRKYSVSGDPRGCKDPLSLRAQLNQVMIRRKRDDISGLFFPERIANTLQFDLTEIEKLYYDQITKYVTLWYRELDEIDEAGKEFVNSLKERYKIESNRYFKRKIGLHKLTLMLLQRRICSSPLSTLNTLANMIEAREKDQFDLESLPIIKGFYDLADNLALRESSKIQNLVKLLERVPNKCVIFTEFTDTLDYIGNHLENHGFSFVKFSGDLSSKKRHDVVKEFWDAKDILLSSDAGSEGLNLQVADTLVNFDVPWNPMRIEQRIGRIYRLTQQADEIHIFNMATKGTIEEYVLDIVYKKIGVFSTILGDLNHILGSMVKSNSDGRSVVLESEIMRFFVKHGHSEKLKQELEALVDPIVDEIQTRERISRDILDVGDVVERL